MKITKNKLKQIIKEELSVTLNETVYNPPAAEEFKNVKDLIREFGLVLRRRRATRDILDLFSELRIAVEDLGESIDSRYRRDVGFEPKDWRSPFVPPSSRREDKAEVITLPDGTSVRTARKD
tara:strand:+ start:1105 stop:1470 length:366 start_codon:yes stop_codon:yes gene_type:complete